MKKICLLIFWFMYCNYSHKCYWFLLEFGYYSYGDLNLLCCPERFPNLNCSKVKLNWVAFKYISTYNTKIEISEIMFFLCYSLELC